MKIFGISNCDTCRKARKWLDESGRTHEWVDLRTDGVSEDKLRTWIDAVGVEVLVNRRSATWRGLQPAQREAAMAPDSAPALLLEHPTLIKRPIFEADGRIHVGFDDSVKRAL